MMEGLVKEAGCFRSGNVGVYAGKQLIHAGSPANYVPEYSIMSLSLFILLQMVMDELEGFGSL